MYRIASGKAEAAFLLQYTYSCLCKTKFESYQKRSRGSKGSVKIKEKSVEAKTSGIGHGSQEVGSKKSS
jgi:hypothetical protein